MLFCRVVVDGVDGRAHAESAQVVLAVAADRKLTSRGCGQKLGRVKPRLPSSCGTASDFGNPATS